jgi:hypothetical protein
MRQNAGISPMRAGGNAFLMGTRSVDVIGGCGT